MKHSKLLLIISTFLITYSCTYDNESAIENSSLQENINIDSLHKLETKSSNDFEPLNDSILLLKRDSLSTDIVNSDSLSLILLKKEELKIVIDRKTYYKKNKNDYRISTKGFIFRVLKNGNEYNIKTGNYVPSSQRDETEG